MPHTDRHSCLLTNKHMYKEVIHFSIETYVILELSICTILRYAYFQNFQALEIWKSDKSGNKRNSANMTLHLSLTITFIYVIKVYFVLLFSVIAHL